MGQTLASASEPQLEDSALEENRDKKQLRSTLRQSVASQDRLLDLVLILAVSYESIEALISLLNASNEIREAAVQIASTLV